MHVCLSQLFFFVFCFILAKLRWEGNATRDSLHCDYTKITKFSNKAWKLASNIYGWSVNAFFLFCWIVLQYLIFFRQDMSCCLWTVRVCREWCIAMRWMWFAVRSATRTRTQWFLWWRSPRSLPLPAALQDLLTDLSVSLSQKALKKKKKVQKCNCWWNRLNDTMTATKATRPLVCICQLEHLSPVALPDGDYPSPRYEIFRFIPRLDLCQNW